MRDCPHHVPTTPASEGAGCAPLACAVGSARAWLLLEDALCWAQLVARSAMACTSAIRLPGRVQVGRVHREMVNGMVMEGAPPHAIQGGLWD
jgi:hypothetical protein